MHPKDADGMANSVDPDQTASSEAVSFWSALFAEIYLSQYIEFERYVRLSKGPQDIPTICRNQNHSRITKISLSKYLSIHLSKVDKHKSWLTEQQCLTFFFFTVNSIWQTLNSADPFR